MNQGLLAGFPVGLGDSEVTLVQRPWQYSNGAGGTLPGMPPRAADTWYQNTESSEITVILGVLHATATGYGVLLSPVKAANTSAAQQAQQAVYLGLAYLGGTSAYLVNTFKVPPGWWCQLVTSTAGYTIQSWVEYRKKIG